jgi:hypothetical protein
MPQPFNKIVPDAYVYVDSGILKDKPEMAILVSQIFAVWAYIEHELRFFLNRPVNRIHKGLSSRSNLKIGYGRASFR